MRWFPAWFAFSLVLLIVPRVRCYQLCNDRNTFWIVSVPSREYNGDRAASAAASFFEKQFVSHGLGTQQLVTVGYTDLENKCAHVITELGLTNGIALKDPKTYTPKTDYVPQPSKMTGFDSWVRVLKTIEPYRADSKTFILYFYDSPSLIGTSRDTSPMETISANCDQNHLASYDQIQEVLLQRGATIVAVKLVNSEETNAGPVSEEKEQFLELRKRGVRVVSLSFEEDYPVDYIGEIIADAIEDECYFSPVKNMADVIRLGRAMANCANDIEWLVFHPDTPTGLGWGIHFGTVLYQLATDLGSFDMWAYGGMVYNDKSLEQFGNNKDAKCVKKHFNIANLRNFREVQFDSKVVEDKGDDRHSGLDAVARALTNLRLEGRAVVLYVHEAGSHFQGESGLPTLEGGQVWEDIRKDINAHCDDHDFVSISKVAELLGRENIIIDISVPPSADDYGIDQFIELSKYSINIGKIDIPHYAGDDYTKTYTKLVQGIGRAHV